MKKSPGCVLHVTEALGGGVLYAVAQLVNSQVDQGWVVVLAHSVRSDTPPTADLDEIFSSRVKRVVIPMVTAPDIWRDFLAILLIWRLVRRVSPTIVHLHSSKAGVVGRLAGVLAGYRQRLFYTPHGYAFLRQDVSRIKRKLFLLFERMATFVSGNVIACSPSEAEMARHRVFAQRVQLVENAVRPRVSKIASLEEGRLKVATVGRISPQKAPGRFKAIADRFSHSHAEFVWIGDGESKSELMTAGASEQTVSVTGWISREGVQETLLTADVFLLLSQWEGLPLSLIEAQLIGLPAIVSDIDGCREAVIDGVTGFVCHSDEDAVSALQRLIDDPILREKMGRAARLFATKRFALEKMVEGTFDAYGVDRQTALESGSLANG
ncbi:glycosyltransferase [Paraburkholderia aspalathi]|uniref:Glycosyltransferase involved in cell wall bisynthesis n=1 Tax=Paraburkholderia aspalathi TaxID=1324617 RepID=A0A1I7E7Q4_9BURK|nr:glycosyltransferase [Paraburkholderia aspalathi]SFU19996.1 Glycosyltransferase involved in cell wall bisynthesis [Paraburkholderia aspalathi]